MILTFRQGIVRYSKAGNTQAFLQKNNNNKVDILTGNDPLIVAIAHGTSDYILNIQKNVVDAWIGPFTPNVDYWLYIDINPITGVHSYGFTTVEPKTASFKPSNPLPNQHWFDTINNKMFSYDSNVWVERIRVFLAKFDGIDFQSVGVGLPNSPFAGSQVNITSTSIAAGEIIFDYNGLPIKTKNKEFFTTESNFYINGANVSNVRLESTVNESKAGENIPRFYVVKYSDFNTIRLANYNDVGNSVIGIVTEDIDINDIGNIILDGIVKNEFWDWQTVGSNLWVKDNGELTEVDPHITDSVSYPKKKVPVARVLDKNRIIFQQGMGGIGEQGIAGSVSGINLATNLVNGIARLTVPGVNPQEPIVVGDNDPRMTDARVPLAHTHPSTDVLTNPYGDLTGATLNLQLEELNDKKLSLSGGTMTGILNLSSDPTNDLEAATKHYVDSLVNGLTWIDPVKTINLINNTLVTPPSNPELSDSYIIASSGTPAGIWATFTNNDVVQWDGNNWVKIGNINTFPNNIRYGIAFNTTTTAAGEFFGKDKQIAIYDNVNNQWSYYTPQEKNALFVNNELAYHGFHQFVFTNATWHEFGGPIPAQSIDALTDVDTSTIAPNIGEFLKWDGTNWIPTTLPQHNIDALTDVDTSTTAPNIGEFLKWDGTNWIPTTLPQHNIDALTDVDTSTTAPNIGEVLQWDGTNWIPTIASGGGSPYNVPNIN